MTLVDAALEADPLRENILLAQSRRQALQAEKIRISRERQRPTYAAASGQVKALGADGPVRLRGNLLAGGVGVGQPVAVSQGLGMSQPAIGLGESVDLSGIQEAIRQLRQMIGVQIKSADPVDATDARYLGDTWLNTASQALFVWVGPPTGWIQTAGGSTIVNHLGDPNTTGPGGGPVTPISGFLFDTSVGRMFNSNAVNTAWVPSNSKVFHEGGPEPTVFYRGDIYQRNDGSISVYDSSAWVQQWYCPTCTSNPADPGPEPPYQGSGA